MLKLPIEALQRWASEVLRACGLPAADANLSAALMVRSDARGWTTHGMTRLPSYVERLRAREFNPAPNMQLQRTAGGIVLDADAAMGQVAAMRALELGREALAQSASVLVVVRDCGHLGALGVFALAAAEAGALCVIGQRTPPLMALPGAPGPAIGHNPIAFGCPLPGAAPIVFDMACSVAARGHILLAAREGQAIPPGWALDAEGQPTTDADQALAGSLLPAGGHKGIGIAMLVECLAGALSASAARVDGGAAQHSASASVPTPLPRSGAVGGQSAFVWLVNPTAYAAAPDFGADMARWTAHYLQHGGPNARLPGHRGAQLEAQAQQDGLPLGPALLQALQELGQRLGIGFPATAAPPHPPDAPRP